MYEIGSDTWLPNVCCDGCHNIRSVQCDVNSGKLLCVDCQREIK